MPNNEKLDICNKALLRAAGVENPEPQYAEHECDKIGVMLPETFLVSGARYVPNANGENNINTASAIEFLTATWQTELQNARTQLKHVSDENVKLRTDKWRLSEALKGLLADITEYQTINNLGGENNHWQAIARKVLNETTE